ncbi:MAG: hypothetical protein IPF73_05590 [Betaproteobacteria bacterium]|nr:hypothetical protein [Betaproteobacteria bacterium]
MRRIWARKCHELGARDPRSMHVRIHTHTSGAVLTAQQPLNNLIRTTLHAFGAALAGVQAMEVSTFDEALAIPTEHSATMALRIQQILQEESGLTRVADPLGGSYYVEALTNQIEAAALKIFDEVEKRGGYHKCHDYVRAQIEASALRWRDQVDAKERILVGGTGRVRRDAGGRGVPGEPRIRAHRDPARDGAARKPRPREVGSGDGRGAPGDGAVQGRRGRGTDPGDGRGVGRRCDHRGGDGRAQAAPWLGAAALSVRPGETTAAPRRDAIDSGTGERKNG